MQTLYEAEKVDDVMNKSKKAKYKVIGYEKLPKKAYAAIGKRQRTYIDEFTFHLYPDGEIHAFYAGDFVGAWDGETWNVVGYGGD